MNHDAAHCISADSERCPKECYRYQLTKELSQIDYCFPVTWSDFSGTEECMRGEQDGTD